MTSSHANSAVSEFVPERIGAYVLHPVASMFPPLEGDAYQDLKKSIEQHGQQQPLVLKDGVLLDGRNRLRILLELSREPHVVEYTGTLAVDDFILVQNLFRRHLTEDQRVMITAEAMLAKETAAAQTRQQEAGKKHGRGRPKVTANSPQANREPTVTERIAATANSTDCAARQAVAVIQHAPELVEPVKQKKMRLPAAHKEAHRRRTSKPRPKPAPLATQYNDEAMDKMIRADAVEAFKHYEACPVERRDEFKRRYYAKLAELWGLQTKTTIFPHGVTRTSGRTRRYYEHPLKRTQRGQACASGPTEVDR